MEASLVYKGFRVAPYCSRCSTPLSSHELAQGYRDNVPDPSVFIRFRLKNDPNTSILAWTTTPWTLPGNVALAVDNDIDYIKVKEGDEYLILAEARLTVLKESPKVVERMKGRDLVGLEYEPLYPYSVPEEGRAQYVVDADFVSTEEGTGVVHTSALYGVDDLRLCQEKGIPFKHTVGLDGKFLPYVEKFAGLHVKEADPVITDDLRERGLLYKAETILHTYPFCWRCGTPLIYYALDAWYIRTTERREELIANNNATNWVPEHIKSGRMGDWLKNNIDWQFSRSRYWGTPVPIWVCEGCEEQRIVSSAAELGLKEDADLHRPYIDAVTLPCEKCGGVMRACPRCWTPGSTRARCRSHSAAIRARARRSSRRLSRRTSSPRPWTRRADGSTRCSRSRPCSSSRTRIATSSASGWSSIPRARKHPSRAATCSTRTTSSTTSARTPCAGISSPRRQVGENYRTGDAALRETVQQFFIPLWNCFSFFVTYARLDGFDPTRAPVPLAERHVLDRWLLSKVSGLAADVNSGLDRLRRCRAGAAHPALRRRPFQLVHPALAETLLEVPIGSRQAGGLPDAVRGSHDRRRLMAPFAPFMADAIYRNLCGGKSVHLADFPASRRSRWTRGSRRNAARQADRGGRAGRTRRRAHQGPAAAGRDRGCQANRSPRRSRRSSARS